MLLFIVLYIIAVFTQQNPTITDKIFIDVSVNSTPAGRIIIGLYGNTVPKTADNFKTLCTGKYGIGLQHKMLNYKSNPFHRIIPSHFIQAGDIVYQNGRGGESIYGYRFNDENFIIKHDRAGRVSMASKGKNSNASQFQIETVASPWLNDKVVAFGQVLEGMDIVAKIEQEGSYNGVPKSDVIIANCGVL